MSTTTIKPIKVLGGYAKKTPTEALTNATAVHSGVYTDPTDYPTPPYDEPTYKAAIDLLSTKIAAALDGGKKAIAERNYQVGVVNKMTAELGHYVEGACKDEMSTFLKSGFRPRSTTKPGKSPLSQAIRTIIQGKVSGQFHLVLMALAAAAAYELRYAPTVNGTPAAWVTLLVTKTRPAVTLTGLTAGTNYSFQVRSFNDATGYGDWSDPVNRIVT